MSEIEPIAKEVLEAARLRFKRRLASMLLSGLAEAGITTAEAEDRIGMRRGGFMAYINRLVAGKERTLDALVDLVTAMGGEVMPSIHMLPSVAPPIPTKESDK